MITVSLEKMARGGVYDQLAGGFHRYSVDEHWIVPHFEKMSYDNSELLKNYVHGYQLTGNEFFAFVASDIVRWMDEVLSDREHGGFYASQDADISLDDDGDYFTWTLDEAEAVLSTDELQVAMLHYDIGEVGEMHHNPAKNVLYLRASIQEVAERVKKTPQEVQAFLDSAKKKMYAARLQRTTPFVDKTVYVGWNALCVSAYLKAARVLKLDDARSSRCARWIAYSPKDGTRSRACSACWLIPIRRPRSDAFPACWKIMRSLPIACLDAYEASADLSYFHFAEKIAAAMVERFHDPREGGFFDMASGPDVGDGLVLGALAARRKPLQDSPTPAGNPMAAIALLRLHAYTNDAQHRDLAEGTLKAFAGIAAHYGLFASTYGIALDMYLRPHTQVVVVGSGARAEQLEAAAFKKFSLNQSVLHLQEGEAVPQMLPPALAETIPNLPAIKKGHTVAVICSGFSCKPPISEPAELEKALAAS